MDERLSTPWRAAEAVPVLLAAAALTALGGAVAGAVLSEETGLVAFGLIFEVSLLAATLGWVLLVRRGGLADLGLTRRGSARHALAGALAGLVIFAVAALLVAPLLVRLVSLFVADDVVLPRQEVIPSGPSGLQIALGAVAVVIAAPFAEELFFRGFLFGALRSRFGFAISAAISAVVFGIFHVIPMLVPVMIVVGFGLAYVYERWGSLAAPIAAHAAFNIVGYTFIVRSMT